MSASTRLRRVARLLAALSVVAGLGAGIAAGVVQAGGRSGSRAGFDYAGWRTVSGPALGSSGPSTYRVPDGADWEVGDVEEKVTYVGAGGTPYAQGQAFASYAGNHCSGDGVEMAGGWVVLEDTRPVTNQRKGARASVLRWARGYGTGEDGQVAPRSEPSVANVTLRDGTRAARARVRLDMTGFESACLDDAAEITAVTFPTQGGSQSLVVARYLGVENGLTTEEYDAILGSVDPG